MEHSASSLAATVPLVEGVSVPVREGQVLEGKYRVERVIGEGAMGLVALAMHLELEERVAVKFLRAEARARPEIASRFAREARAAATIKNDHVARVYDVGTHEGNPFIVMEFLEGEDLEKLLEKNGPLDPMTAADYVIQACEGLTAAHVKRIVHRDIKPGNLFLTEHGGLRDVKVLDFGISKAGVRKGTFEDVDLVAGDTNQIMGSPHYMSPEQIRSTRDVDPRADIWSLGVVLYELITNHPPFDGGEVTSLIAQVLHETHRPARSFVPTVPPPLEEVIDRCLEKDPAKRFQTAAELAMALVPFAPKRSRAVAERAMTMMDRASGRQIVLDSLPPPAPERSPTPAPSAPAPAAPKSAAPWIALVAVVVGLGGGSFAIFSSVRATPAPPKPDPVVPVVATSAKADEPPKPLAPPTPEPVESAPPPSKAATSAARPLPPPPLARPKPKASASASAISPDREIRHER